MELITGELVTSIGAKYNKTGAQVALKWQVVLRVPLSNTCLPPSLPPSPPPSLPPPLALSLPLFLTLSLPLSLPASLSPSPSLPPLPQ
jgi:hypothetical protein